MGDRAEFVAGTDPTDSDSALRLQATRSQAGVIITWNAVPGRTYRVQRKDDLIEPIWSDLAGDITVSEPGPAMKVEANVCF